MTLPANDAFSLGLAHDQPRRSRTPSSPKILFSPSPARAMSKKSHRRKQTSDQHTSQEPDTRTSASLSQKRNSKHSRTSSTPNGSAPPNGVDKPHVTPIDWEIPRKALHASIGVCHHLCILVADRKVSDRISHPIPLYFERGPSACHCRAQLRSRCLDTHRHPPTALSFLGVRFRKVRRRIHARQRKGACMRR